MPDDSERAAAGEPLDSEADNVTMGPPTLAPKLRTLLPAAFARLRRRRTGEEKPIPLPWKALAEKLGGGLWPGLHVLVGNTGTGKTQWALEAAIHAAQQDTPVLYVALEANEMQFVTRCIGLLDGPGTYWSRLYHGHDEHLERILTTHEPTLKALPIHVRFAPPRGWNYNNLTAEATALRETYPEKTPGDTPLLVILDFLQIVGAGDPQERHEDLRERIGNAANVAGAVARDHNAAVILASSTARANYEKVSEEEEAFGQGSPARLVGLGKETGEIEYAADTVLVLMKGGLALAKMRAGVPDWAPLTFNGHRFTEPPNKEPLPGAPSR